MTFLCAALVLLVLAALLGLQLVRKTPASQPAGTETGATPVAATEAKAQVPGPSGPENLYIAHEDPKAGRTIHTVLTTRKGGTVYQAFVRYQPQNVPLAEVPGLSDLSSIMQLPPFITRVDQETEMLIDNLGQVGRSVISSHLYLHPYTAHVIAYDLASTSGGQAQRFVGHLTRSGITVEVFRGGESIDRHELPFSSRDTFIPVEYEFIHQWFLNNPEALKAQRPVNFSIFIPEVMCFLLLTATPKGEEVVPIGSATYDCARYEVITTSTQSAETLQGRQTMWFDKRKGVMMKREDFEASLKPGDAPVTERGGIENLAQMQELLVRAPTLPPKPLPYPLDQNITYTVQVPTKPDAASKTSASPPKETGGAEFGRVRLHFSRCSANAAAGGATYEAVASVNLESQSSGRHETATTRFDANWMPIWYEASGDEFGEGDAKATYALAARVRSKQIEVSLKREVDQQQNSDTAPETQNPKSKNQNPEDPLVRVPISDEELKAQQTTRSAPRLTAQTIARPLSEGTFLYDFNRVEQLAVLAARLPLPPAGTEAGATGSPLPREGEGLGVRGPQASYQKAALYCVRQNRCGIIMFEIKPEPRPALSERQKLRLTTRDRQEPQLYVASVASALLPCRMLLTPDGRMLELTLKYGNQEVVYTLDDPIMRYRAERARRQKLQEGPQLIRAPWW
ncbi:MAG TPA: hypothetical protein VGP72_29705 [Planctomycetota bacterium]|jgi:hypothetical protein